MLITLLLFIKAIKLNQIIPNWIKINQLNNKIK